MKKLKVQIFNHKVSALLSQGLLEIISTCHIVLQSCSIKISYQFASARVQSTRMCNLRFFVKLFIRRTVFSNR